MDALEKSIIVVAHPDDENLWFSSILSKVDSIALCFISIASQPAWTEGRRKSLAEYPLKNVTCLQLEESDVFWGVDWHHPVRTGYGLEITDRQLSDARYRKNYDVLKDKLRETLQGYLNVFTHNPWGEYGHVEHVQVYRAVKSLQQEMKFNIWFSSYVSNKSAFLMAAEYPRIGPNLGRMKTDRPLAESIAAIYRRNNCWTWYEDYKWCAEETFIRDIDSADQKGKAGEVLPLNMIDVGVEPAPVKKPLLHRLRRKVGRLLRPWRGQS